MILVIDNAIPDIDAVRQRAINATYIDYEAPDGQTYKRVCAEYVQSVHDLIRKHFGTVQLHTMGFRLNYAGELPNQLVHYDKDWGTHAMVLYLRDDERGGGTEFYEHDNRSMRYGDKASNYIEQDDWNDRDKWFRHALVRMIVNRAVFYTSDQYHARSPADGFGFSPENGRLIAVAFFTPVDVR